MIGKRSQVAGRQSGSVALPSSAVEPPRRGRVEGAAVTGTAPAWPCGGSVSHRERPHVGFLICKTGMTLDCEEKVGQRSQIPGP